MGKICVQRIKIGSVRNYQSCRSCRFHPELSVLQVLQVPSGTISLAGLAGSIRNYQSCRSCRFRPELSVLQVLQVLQVPSGTISLAGLAGSVRNYQSCKTRIKAVKSSSLVLKVQLTMIHRATYITKTCLYNFDPLKPHFYIEKTGVYRGIHYFSYFCSKHRLWVFVRTTSSRRF